MGDNSEIEETLSDTEEMEDIEYDSDATVMSEDIFSDNDGDNNRNGNNHQVDTVSESVDPGEDSIQLRNEDDNRGGNIEDIQVDPGSPIIGSQRQTGRIRREPSVEIMEDSDEEPERTSGQVISATVRTSDDDTQAFEAEAGQGQSEQAIQAEQEVVQEQTPEAAQAPETAQAPEAAQAPEIAQIPEAAQASELRQAPDPEQVVAEEQTNPRPRPSSEVTPKKTTTGPPPVPPSPESDDEGQICSICFEPWANSGNHRLASLKCGHMFGFSCIEHWLKGQGSKCPQCNAKARKMDIRVLYAKSLKVLDTSEKDRVVKELEKERESKRKLELEHAQIKLKYELKTQLVVKLQEELRMMKNSVAGSSISSSQSIGLSQVGSNGTKSKFRLVMNFTLEMIKDGGCRVMAYNEWLGMMVVSLPSQVAMFPGCGVKKINVLDMKSERYVPIHQKQIRDLAFNPTKNDLLLSVAMDKLVKITNICNNTTVGSYTADAPLWSCCWNADEVNQFFVGTATGSVIQYEISNTSGPKSVTKISGSGPVVSMCYIPFKASASFSNGGLLVARLQSVSFVEFKNDSIVDHVLPFEGPFTSVSFENQNRHILISCRPSQRYPHARHMVCELQSVNVASDDPNRTRLVTGNIIHTFKGGTTQKVLSRSVILGNPMQDGSVLVCASDESTQSTCIWDLSSVSCIQQLKGAENVIDIQAINSNQNSFLALLTDKFVKFYKWVNVL